jgi:DNA-binding MarR family transcriptional regulator
MAGAPDFLDGLLAAWVAAVPGIDVDSLGAVTRVRRLATYLERGADHALAPLGMTLWQLEVLAFLLPAQRNGLQVSQLLPAALLSPAAMTNRLDRLQQAGWVDRIPDREDRRATRIRLTRTGRALTKRALQVRSDAAVEVLAALSPAQRANYRACCAEFFADCVNSKARRRHPMVRRRTIDC